MGYQTDFVVHSREGGIALLVEAKGKRGASAQWAAELRRNMLAHGELPRSEYFLVAVPDRLYLWRGAGASDRLPDHNGPASAVFSPYLSQDGPEIGTLSEWGLELVVSSWLHDLTGGSLRPGTRDARWLHDSGLLDSLRGGRVAAEVSV